MDRMVSVAIKGKERQLNYSIEVMFEMTEKFGTIQRAFDMMQKETREGFEVVRWFAVRMANDGELCRRERGEDSLPMISEKDISCRMTPLEYEELKGAVVKAISSGYKREVEDQEEVDLDLLEIERKKEAAGA